MAASLLDGERQGRVAFEVYPHTIHIRLFGLSERLPYKAKGGRRVAMRRGVLQDYQGHLRRLLEREAPGVLRSADVGEVLSAHAAEQARGRGLKHLEDVLDGLTCAIAAYLVWHDPKGWEMLGDAASGYIIAPGERPNADP